MRGVALREIFAFQLAKYQKVNAFGLCPREDKIANASIRLGLTEKERIAMSHKHKKTGTIELFEMHKFVIVFENSGTFGYLSEKLVNGWLAKSIPIYFGCDEATLKENLNMKAFIHCPLPQRLGTEEGLAAMSKRFCEKANTNVLSEKIACENEFLKQLEIEVHPFFKKCVEKVKLLDENDDLYDEMISQPLLPEGKLINIWNRTLSAEILQDIYNVYYPEN